MDNHHEHKTEEAKSKCWSCSHPEKLQPSEEDFAKAQRLIDEGWESTSNRYCSVSRLRLPPMDKVLKISGDLPTWARTEIERHYESLARRQTRVHGEHLTLTPGEFRGFKLLGGRSN